jgi:hypothetical protein
VEPSHSRVHPRFDTLATMWRLCILAVAACYSPRVQTGVPCTPEVNNCPDGQTCARVNNEFVCSEGFLLADAGIDATAVTWALIQTAGIEDTSVMTMATGAGHLIVVGVENDGEPVTAVTDNAGNSYVLAPGSRSKHSVDMLGVEVWYAKNSKAGATRITVAPSAASVVMWEVAGVNTTDPLTAATKLDDQPTSTTPLGASITTTSVGEFVVSIAIVEDEVSGIRPGNAFTNDQRVFGNGWAHLTDPASPAGSYQAQWNQPGSGTSCASSVAFRRGP